MMPKFYAAVQDETSRLALYRLQERYIVYGDNGVAVNGPRYESDPGGMIEEKLMLLPPQVCARCGASSLAAARRAALRCCRSRLRASLRNF